MKFIRANAPITVNGPTMRYISEDGVVRVEANRQGVSVSMTRPLLGAELDKLVSYLCRASMQHLYVVTNNKLANERELIELLLDQLLVRSIDSL